MKIYSEIVPEEKRAGRKELLSYLENRYADIRKPVAAKDKKSLISASRWKNRYLLLDKWMQVKQNGHNLSEYLEAHSCTCVAIYGMGYLGRRLYDELEGTSIIVKCVIDRDAQMLSGLLDVREPGERIYGVDAIIIALAEDEETIMDLYGGREEGILIKLADMIDSVYNA